MNTHQDIFRPGLGTNQDLNQNPGRRLSRDGQNLLVGKGLSRAPHRAFHCHSARRQAAQHDSHRGEAARHTSSFPFQAAALAGGTHVLLWTGLRCSPMSWGNPSPPRPSGGAASLPWCGARGSWAHRSGTCCSQGWRKVAESNIIYEIRIHVSCKLSVDPVIPCWICESIPLYESWQNSSDQDSESIPPMRRVQLSAHSVIKLWKSGLLLWLGVKTGKVLLFNK